LLGRDNHPLAATAKMAILIVAVFSSRLSRYIQVRAVFRFQLFTLCGDIRHGQRLIGE
jgi:hypothetical protein